MCKEDASLQINKLLGRLPVQRVIKDGEDWKNFDGGDLKRLLCSHFFLSEMMDAMMPLYRQAIAHHAINICIVTSAYHAEWPTQKGM